MAHRRFAQRVVYVLVLALLAAVPSAAQSAWSTTMTVGFFGDTGVFRGYSEAHRYGALDNVNFHFDDVNYTVDNLSYGVALDAILFTMSSSFPHDGWTLTVGDQVFALDEARERNRELPDIPGYSFVWDTDAFDNWTNGQEVSVSLVGPRSVPALPVPALGLLLALLIAAAIRRRLEDADVGGAGPALP